MLRGVLNIKVKLSNILAIGGALAIMVGSVAIVKAVIPDTAGVIHGCYKNNSGTLRVVDSPSQVCAGGETALNWNQTGPQGPAGSGGNGEPKAYGRVTIDSSNGYMPVLDTAHSSKITSVEYVNDGGSGQQQQSICVKLDSAVSDNFNGAIVASQGNGEFGDYAVKTKYDFNSTEWGLTCPNGADFIANGSTGGSPPYSFYFTVY